MAAHDLHHYVPRFLLEAWTAPVDRKLFAFHWEYGGKFKHGRYSTKAVAKHARLYSLNVDEDKNRIERDFFGNEVDSPGATAYQELLAGRVAKLSTGQKEAWARFLVSLLVRGPDVVGHMNKRGVEILKEALGERPEEYNAVRGTHPTRTLLDHVEANEPQRMEDVGVRSLPSLVTSPRLNGALLQARWTVRDLPWTTHDLLIGDKPLIYEGALETRFLIALPLAPRRVFFAYNADATGPALARLSDEIVVKEMNRGTIGQAMKYVYASNGRHSNYIEKNLKRPAAMKESYE